MKAKKDLLLNMIKVEFKNRFAITGLGALWGFITPIIYVLIYAFVFQYILKTNQANNIPYIVWFLPGMVIWNFLNDAIIQSANSIRDYAYLIKKMKFPISIIPLVKILSSLIISIVLIIVAIIISVLNSYYPNILGVTYYLIAAFFLIYAISKLTATLVIMFGDFFQILNVILQILFWITPVIWNAEILEIGILQTITNFNPFAYIVTGMRNVFVNDSFFAFGDIKYSIIFWSIVLIIYIYGNFIFNKNKKYFVDVL